MKTLHFNIEIDSPIGNVYSTMLDKEHFSNWVSPFHHDSYFVGSWKKGSDIWFIARQDDGALDGMYSRILENKKNKFVSIEHLGAIKDGKKVTESGGEDSFSGALEEYRFERKDGHTVVRVRCDTNDKYEAYFKETWPKALQKLKTICEAN